MYRIALFDKTATMPPEKMLFNISVKAWGKRINGPSRLLFSMPKWSKEATPDNLKKFRRVQLQRKNKRTGEYQAVFSGYIEAHTVQSDSIEVLCPSMLEYFNYRYSDPAQVLSGQGSTEAHDLLTATNTDDDTGVIVGTGGVTTTKSITADRQEISRVWESLASAHEAEYEIDPNFMFNFVPQLGIDRSSNTIFSFYRDGKIGSNMYDVQEGEDAREMANRVYAKSGAFSTERNDLTSQAEYGVIADSVTFVTVEANDIGTLESMADSYMTQRANPPQELVMKPQLTQKKIDTVTGQAKIIGHELGDVSLGDIVTTRIFTENKSLNTIKRVAEIQVTVSENGNEEVRYSMTDPFIFITAAYLDFDQVAENKRRIKALESLL